VRWQRKLRFGNVKVDLVAAMEMLNSVGTKKSVADVANTRPPMTAQPSGARTGSATGGTFGLRWQMSLQGPSGH
jgi:hypothetical protein